MKYKSKHKTFNFVDKQINPEHHKDCKCKVKCKETWRDRFKKGFKGFCPGVWSLATDIELIGFISTEIIRAKEEEREKVWAEARKLVLTAKVFRKPARDYLRSLFDQL